MSVGRGVVWCSAFASGCCLVQAEFKRRVCFRLLSVFRSLLFLGKSCHHWPGLLYLSLPA